VSQVLVVYTERVLLFKGRSLNIPVRELGTRVRESPFIDSVKVRLLSPFSKALESVNDKNVAIGKIRGISSSLRYFEDRSIKKLVYDRLLYKFRDFIKGPHHRTIRAIESLPYEVGGLGMAYDTRYLANLPPIFNRALRTLKKGGAPGFWAQSALGRIFSNSESRGIDTHAFIKRWVETLVKYHVMTRFTRSAAGWFSEIDPTDQLSYREKFAILKRRNIVSLKELPNYIEKSFVIRRLLEQKEVSTGFRTDSMAKRVARCWNSLESIEFMDPDDSPLSEEELESIVKVANSSLMIDLNAQVVQVLGDPQRFHEDEENPLLVTRPSSRKSVKWRPGQPDLRWQTTVKDVLLYGMPSMTVSTQHLTKM